MKTAYLLLSITAAAAITAFAAISADSPSYLSLTYVDATQVYDGIKQQLGPRAAAAVSADTRTNRMKLNAAHPDAAKIRELVEKLDQRRPTVKVAAVIKRIIPATATSEAHEEILSRPTVFGGADLPITLTFQDDAHRTIKVELLVTPSAEQPK